MIPNLPAICDTDASCDSVSTIQLTAYDTIQAVINGANAIIPMLSILIPILVGAVVVGFTWSTIVLEFKQICAPLFYVGKHRKQD